MSGQGSGTQELLLAVGNAAPAPPVCHPMAADMAAKHDLVSLLRLHDEATTAIVKPEALSSKALKEC